MIHGRVFGHLEEVLGVCEVGRVVVHVHHVDSHRGCAGAPLNRVDLTRNHLQDHRYVNNVAWIVTAVLCVCAEAHRYFVEPDSGALKRGRRKVLSPPGPSSLLLFFNI